MNRISLELLRLNYYNGFFPMADDDGYVDFWGVKMRALLPIQGIHVSRSLARRIRKGGFEITFNLSFLEVMEGCRAREETWINDEIIELFGRAHHAGMAHSCECWMDGVLAGGVYGLRLGRCFSAESMFHRATDASKLALWALVNRCKDSGLTMFDAQIINPFLTSLGAFEITHEEYLARLQPWFSWNPEKFP